MKKLNLIIILLFSTTNLFSKSSNTKEYLQTIYSDISGYNISEQDRETVNKNGSAVYGEIKYESLKTILDDLKPNKNDVFYDLGSGVGKATVQASLDYKFNRCFGIELSKERHEQAEKICKLLKKDKKISRYHNVIFKNQDIAKTNFKNASIIYICSTCYPESLINILMKKFKDLKPGTRILTLKSLHLTKNLELVKTYNLAVSWSKSSPIYLYKII
ncbi:MAG: hypothetical protein ABIF12_03610 [bacterium]